MKCSGCGRETPHNELISTLIDIKLGIAYCTECCGKCKKCGKQVYPEWWFCMYCGEPTGNKEKFGKKRASNERNKHNE
jgi:hypothetical protein